VFYIQPTFQTTCFSRKKEKFCLGKVCKFLLFQTDTKKLRNKLSQFDKNYLIGKIAMKWKRKSVAFGSDFLFFSLTLSDSYGQEIRRFHQFL
jgi:hypothetical protein